MAPARSVATVALLTVLPLSFAFRSVAFRNRGPGSDETMIKKTPTLIREDSMEDMEDDGLHGGSPEAVGFADQYEDAQWEQNHDQAADEDAGEQAADEDAGEVDSETQAPVQEPSDAPGQDDSGDEEAADADAGDVDSETQTPVQEPSDTPGQQDSGDEEVPVQEPHDASGQDDSDKFDLESIKTSPALEEEDNDDDNTSENGDVESGGGDIEISVSPPTQGTSDMIKVTPKTVTIVGFPEEDKNATRRSFFNGVYTEDVTGRCMSGRPTYWMEGEHTPLLYYCKKAKRWAVAVEDQWEAVKSGECANYAGFKVGADLEVGQSQIDFVQLGGVEEDFPQRLAMQGKEERDAWIADVHIEATGTSFEREMRVADVCA